MRTSSIILLGIVLAAPLVGATGFQGEVGASYFWFNDSRLKGAPPPLDVDEPGRFAPFVAVAHAFNESVGLRLSYHFIHDVNTTAVTFRSPQGGFEPFTIWGHFDDDVHLVSLAPEFSWSLNPKVTFGIAPQLNWVASRGVVSYSTDSPLVLLVGPQKRNDEGFTAGGAVRVRWALTPEASLTLGYQYSDLDPSFNRRAHAISGGFSWRF